MKEKKKEKIKRRKRKENRNEKEKRKKKGKARKERKYVFSCKNRKFSFAKETICGTFVRFPDFLIMHFD